MNADDVIRILNELCNKLGIAIDWSVDNVMPYYEQAVAQLSAAKCNIYHGLFIGSILLLCIGLLLFLPENIKVYIKDKSKYINWGNGPGFGLFIIVSSIVCAVIFYVLWIQWRDMPTIMAVKWFISELRGSR